jgi:glycosyltransferase involved in cell wall biosynthesis
VVCYLSQTYPNKELIIVSQGAAADNALIRSHISGLNRGDILFFEASPRLCLGAMRNLSCEIATGDIICQWDDDDLYHPVRLMSQYKAMRSDSDGVASAYCAFLKYFSQSNEMYWCDWRGEGRPLSRYLPGSVMFYKMIFFKRGSLLYPEDGGQCHVEEDLNVLGQLFRHGRVVSLFEAYHYVYSYHGENTYNLDHHRLTLLTNSGKTVMSAEQILERRLVLEETFGLIGVGAVDMRSLDGPVFSWPC